MQHDEIYLLHHYIAWRVNTGWSVRMNVGYSRFIPVGPHLFLHVARVNFQIPSFLIGLVKTIKLRLILLNKKIRSFFNGQNVAIIDKGV